MYAILLAVHVVISVSLILVVLLQSGKGGGLAGAFGGAGGVGAVFGGQTAATFLSKATRYLAVVFMVSSLSLALLVGGRPARLVTDSLEEQEAVPATVAGELVPPPTGVGEEQGTTEGEAPAERIPVAPDETGP